MKATRILIALSALLFGFAVWAEDCREIVSGLRPVDPVTHVNPDPQKIPQNLEKKAPSNEDPAPVSIDRGPAAIVDFSNAAIEKNKREVQP